MSEPTNQDIKDLILALDKRIDNLDQKFEVQFTEIKGEIKRVEQKLEAKIDGAESRLEAKIDGVESKLEAKIDGIKETLEAKLDGLDKRLGNEEIISRSAFAAVVVGALAGMVKYLFFSKL